MSAENEAVVRRFYEEMNNGRKNELAVELFTADHQMHDPQVPDVRRSRRHGRPPCRPTRPVLTDIGRSTTSSRSNDNVVVRWTGTGEHVADLNGIAPTGKKIDVSAISIHRMADGKIAETWEVWDTLGFLQQLGVIPDMA